MQRLKKICSTLLILSSLLIIQSCVTKPKSEIKLPPRPQRQELKEAETVEDLADMINYYEHLLEEWEAWGDSVELILTK